MNAFAALAPLQVKLHDQQEDLCDELMDRVGDFDLDALTTLELCDEATAWLRLRIAAMDAEREDEKAHPMIDWDHEWLGASRSTLKQARFLLVEITRRAGAFRLASRAKETAARNQSGERLFVDVARRVLSPDQFTAIWDTVFTERPDLRPQRKAAAIARGDAT